MAEQLMSTKKNGFVLDNVFEIQDKLASPIWGYQDVPIRKLEEAINETGLCSDSIKTYINQAKQSCKKTDTKLTLDESAAIYLYTMQTPIHIILNNLLRTENQTELKFWFSYLKLLITALNKLPLQANTLVWRGVSSDISLDLSNLDTNYTQRWWTVNSCSKDLNVIKSYLKNGSGTVFAIETIYGKYIAEYSAFRDEQEVILIPGARLLFKANASECKDDLSIVHLEEYTVIPEEKHVMLSYHDNDQELISEISAGLLTANIPIWTREPKTSHNIRQSLTQGIEKATVVCCFLTPEYEQNLECQFELQYAEKQSKKIILCILTNPNIWKPSDWLKSIINNCLCIEYDIVTNSVDSDYIINGLRFYLHNQSSLLKRVSKKITNKSNYCFELIRYEYQRNTRIERLFNPAKSFTIEQSYINLAIVETKQQIDIEKKLSGKTNDVAVLGIYEEIYGAKKTVNIEDIFKTCNSWRKQVLVFGRAGIGKSTFCRFVAFQWAKGLLWTQYELLVIIPLRRLTETYSLTDLVKKTIFKSKLSKDEETYFEQHFNPEKTLWILDGYDEIQKNLPTHLKDLLDQLLATPHHIITSRPYQNTLSYEVQLEITGFTDKNIEQYVNQFFDQLKDELDNSLEKTESLLTFLRSNKSAFGIAHIPVNLELICSIWSKEDLSTNKNVTITTLYTRITKWLCRRYLLSKDINIKILDEKTINNKCHYQLYFLQFLAFQAMKTNTIVIRSQLIENALENINISLETHPDILNFGVLKSFSKQGLDTQIELEKDHYFIHLSFQEYFAARHVVHLLQQSSTNEVIQFIQSTKYDQRYTLMFTFIVGLLYDNNQSSGINIFWNTLFNEPIDLVGIRHMQLIISCLQAISPHNNVKYWTDFLQLIKNIIKHNIYHGDQIVIDHLASYLCLAQNVACDKLIIDFLLGSLQCNQTEILNKVLRFIGRASLSNPSTELIDSIATLIEHRDQDVGISACFALTNINQIAAIDPVISKLLNPTINRSTVANTLWVMGTEAMTNEFVNKLANDLVDEREQVRSSAYYALENMDEKAAIDEIINKLLNTLKDQNEEISSSACDALGEMSEKVVTVEVIDKVLSALPDDREDVRSRACYALGKMGEKAATDEVINKLLNTLADQSGEVRQSARLSLSEICKKTATDEVIQKLLSALADENRWIRSGVYYVLGKMGDKAATDEVIKKLSSALTDQSEGVRQSAYNALGKMGEKAATNEVIVHFVKLMTNDDHQRYFLHINGLRELLSYSSDLIRIDPMIFEDYYFKKSGDILSSIPVERLLSIWCQSKNDRWLFVTIQSILRRGAGVTIYKKKVIIYDMRIPVEVSFLSDEQQQLLHEQFINQAKQCNLRFEFSTIPQ